MLTAGDHIKTVVKLLTANSGAQRLSLVFEDFVEMAAISMRNTFDRHDARKRELRYSDIASRYSREQLDRFSQALAHVTAEMEDNPSDVLGRVYMSLDLGNEHLGQFFTPDDVAALMAAIQIPSLTGVIRAKGIADVHEPACGAGALLIAMTQELRRQGINYQKTLRVQAEDVAHVAVHMAYIQLTLLHVPAVVHHRNTLTQETFDSWPTLAWVMAGASHPSTPAADTPKENV